MLEPVVLGLVPVVALGCVGFSFLGVVSGLAVHGDSKCTDDQVGCSVVESVFRWQSPYLLSFPLQYPRATFALTALKLRDMYINSAIVKLIVIVVLGHRISTRIVAERKRRKMDYIYIGFINVPCAFMLATCLIPICSRRPARASPAPLGMFARSWAAQSRFGAHIYCRSRCSGREVLYRELYEYSYSRA